MLKQRSSSSDQYWYRSGAPAAFRFASSSVRTPPPTSGPSSGRHRSCRNPTRSRLGQSERNARAQQAELAAPPLLSFLHLARNSAYVSFCYRQSGSPLVADGRPGRVVWYAGCVRMSATQSASLGFANWPQPIDAHRAVSTQFRSHPSGIVEKSPALTDACKGAVV